MGSVWQKDLITGIGDVVDDRFQSGDWHPDIDGDFAYFNGTGPGFGKGLPQNYYHGCQWYVYCGPDLNNRIATSTYSNYFATGTLVEDNSESGIGGIAGASAVLTDNDPTLVAYGSKSAGLSTANLTDGYKMGLRVIIEKDLTTTHTSALIFSCGNSAGQVKMTATINQSTGEINDLGGTAVNTYVESHSDGNYWDFYLQMDSPTGGTTDNTAGAYSIVPAYNTDGSATPNPTLTGLSIKVVDSAIYSSLTQDIPIGHFRRSGLVTNIGGFGSRTVDQSIVYIDPANHDDTAGGYYIEWRPQYDTTEITRDVEILSLNDTYGLLYYDYTNNLLTATDGTNIATKSLTVVAETKYRLGVVYGTSGLQVGVDGDWGALTSYDGAFPAGANFSLFRNSEAVNLWRELRGFHTDFNTAKTEIELIMRGGGSGDFLPAPPDTDPQTEIVAPFWENTGNWIDLTALTNTTFAAMFGDVIEAADFDSVITVNQAALVNTSDSGNRLQIQDSIDCTNAALYITDASGNVVDSMIYNGSASGDSVLVPTGANYYVVISSDTGNARIKKWDSSEVNTSGSVSWESFFGKPFSLTGSFDKTNIIPQEGISLRFTVPETAGAYGISFSTKENTALSSSRTGSVNQVVNDFTSAPSVTWGTGVNITGGVNYAGQDISLTPGTYFFNVRNNDPSASANYCRIVVYSAAV